MDGGGLAHGHVGSGTPGRPDGPGRLVGDGTVSRVHADHGIAPHSRVDRLVVDRLAPQMLVDVDWLPPGCLEDDVGALGFVSDARLAGHVVPRVFAADGHARFRQKYL